MIIKLRGVERVSGGKQVLERVLREEIRQTKPTCGKQRTNDCASEDSFGDTKRAALTALLSLKGDTSQKAVMIEWCSLHFREACFEMS